MALYARAIVAAGSLSPAGETIETALRFRRRPGHCLCRGYLNVGRSDIPPHIDYECPVCGKEYGTIHGWKNSEADLSAKKSGSAKAYGFLLDPEGYETLRSILPQDSESERVVYVARRSGERVRLTATLEDLAALQGFINLHVTYEPRQQQRRRLIRLFAILAGVVPGSR